MSYSEVSCPKCGSPNMWDQKNGKYPWKQGTPIFKCRDKECAANGGVIWEPKTAAKAPPARTAPPSAGPLLPNEEGEEEYLKALTGQPVAPPVNPKQVDVDLLKECVGYALGIVQDAQRVINGTTIDIAFTADNVCSLASTLFIKWTRGK